MYALESADRARKTGAATPTENAAGMATDAGCKPHNSSGWPNSHGRGQSGINPDALHGESPVRGVAPKSSTPLDSCGVRGPLGGIAPTALVLVFGAGKKEQHQHEWRKYELPV